MFKEGENDAYKTSWILKNTALTSLNYLGYVHNLCKPPINLSQTLPVFREPMC